MSPSRNGVILASHVWKRFHADRQRRVLRDQLQRLPARLRGHEHRGWRWALRDVDLTIDAGESVALVGSNGSGKSTLLKLLSMVMYPYSGRVETGGRVGALIEVRAGIHPDLTGRENVQLYGALLGLGRRQVFAVAAFLEPDVLLVDEVLAVGDATFQQRCLERMRTVLAHGTTLVFVSHDLAAVEATCDRGVWLRQGIVEVDGPVREVVAGYRESIEAAAESAVRLDGELRVSKLEASGPDGGTPRTQQPLEVRLILDSPRAGACRLYLGISEGTPSPIFVLRRDLDLTAGQIEARCTIPRLPLPRGRFFLWVGVFEGLNRDPLPWQPAARFDVTGPNHDGGPHGVICLAPVHVEAAWQVERR